MNILSLGGSRNIGYFSAIRLLDSGCTVTFLLRNLSKLQDDEVIGKYVASGKAFLVKGDALEKSDVENGWKEAGKHGNIDVLLFTVGGTPEMSLTKGAIIKPADLVTRSFMNTITTMPTSQPQPKIIAVSSTGLTKTSHASLPLPLKPLYAWMLALPHKDKIGLEIIIHHCAGWTWNSKEDGEADEGILPSNWTSTPGLPAPGTLKNVLVVRPAMLTDGECQAEKKKKGSGSGKSKPAYRVSEGELGGYTVSRRDVAHFIADVVLNKWETYADKVVNIGY
ncbi:hypothetical protein E1B28_013672 [Marasmius oreades]|uniref:NAD(P)-binding domain-containing protein n=1 Tax=Marasmius oreades TaxID=181124 RepID=A0A9P7RR42_9AGAR|nr:uncharacterized protein E1B28_013672 [Marasmius oreades]KAG7087726.1 hypothetical protein E1B28_013672 [Marasmius oreades]